MLDLNSKILGDTFMDWSWLWVGALSEVWIVSCVSSSKLMIDDLDFCLGSTGYILVLPLRIDFHGEL